MRGSVFSASSPQAAGVGRHARASRPTSSPLAPSCAVDGAARARPPAASSCGRNTAPAANRSASRMPCFAARSRAGNRVGLLEQQAAAVAGLAVGGNGAAVREAGERGDRRLHDPVARLIVEVGDQAESAAVAFVGGVVQTLGGICLHGFPKASARGPEVRAESKTARPNAGHTINGSGAPGAFGPQPRVDRALGSARMLPNALETWRPMIPAERQSSMLRRVSMRAEQQYKPA